MAVFNLPDLGEGLQEAEIVAWHVAAGEHVVADQPLVSVETAKAVVEIPAPWAGRVAKTFAGPGDVVVVGAPLAELETEGAVTDAGAVVGRLPGAAQASRPAEPAKPPPAPMAVGALASPAVRKRAAELGIDLAQVSGSGPGGTITMADLAAGAGRPKPPAGYAPLAGVRRAMAESMARSGAEIVPSSVTDEAIVEHWPRDADATARLVRAIVAGCRAAPELNAWFDMRSRSRRLHDQVDLGIAMETGDGLFVPVLRDVGRRSEADLRTAIETMKREVASRSVALQDLSRQTITLSNFGMLGGRHAVLAVMPPQVAILGAGRIERAVRVIGETISIVRVLPLSLTFDHRAVTGAEALRFLGAVVADLSRP
jgi:pyruvate dehydrogenase E2 component (dihydrolipoamide acetyltransferase)